MKAINTHYVLVKKLKQEKKEGFTTVDIQDNFIYKGQVTRLPEQPVFVDNYQVQLDDVVVFAKYSPDTHEVEVDGEKMKMVTIKDLMYVD